MLKRYTHLETARSINGHFVDDINLRLNKNFCFLSLIFTHIGAMTFVVKTTNEEWEKNQNIAAQCYGNKTIQVIENVKALFNL